MLLNYCCNETRQEFRPFVDFESLGDFRYGRDSKTILGSVVRRL